MTALYAPLNVSVNSRNGFNDLFHSLPALSMHFSLRILWLPAHWKQFISRNSSPLSSSEHAIPRGARHPRKQNSLSKLIMKQLIVSQKCHNAAIALSNMREENKEQNFTTSAKCQVTTSTFSTKHQQFCLFRHPSASAYVHQSEWFFLSANAFYIMLRNFWCSSRKKM